MPLLRKRDKSEQSGTSIKECDENRLEARHYDIPVASSSYKLWQRTRKLQYIHSIVGRHGVHKPCNVLYFCKA